MRQHRSRLASMWGTMVAATGLSTQVASRSWPRLSNRFSKSTNILRCSSPSSPLKLPISRTYMNMSIGASTSSRVQPTKWCKTTTHLLWIGRHSSRKWRTRRDWPLKTAQFQAANDSSKLALWRWHHPSAKTLRLQIRALLRSRIARDKSMT